MKFFALVAVVAAIVPPFKLAFASNKESSVSRGEVLFKEASMVKDQLGFLAKVKLELQELFDFLREFDDKIVLVPIIDDLDRCITDGRNVKVLEAMQLISQLNSTRNAESLGLSPKLTADRIHGGQLPGIAWRLD